MCDCCMLFSIDSSNKRAKEGLEKAERKAEGSSRDTSYVTDSLEQSSEVSPFIKSTVISNQGFRPL